ncbi:MAG: hypothetical protein DI603_15265 [Roseateles depolymerans]|uniref:Uncharacterized protein n=1 Tax=Roseateles depolymerans TaxID=76731 RepID=A0A2W5FKW4_9BURK|nr:MAG: hypothetical protein DI603_15265 [Roseateles depolymerans]
MIGRLLRPADFERVLSRPGRVRSAHFVLHHLAADPLPPVWSQKQARPGSDELSTGEAPAAPAPVEHVQPSGRWLGMVVPKRFAKRSVTRSLLKRQIRAAFQARVDMPPGLWVVRLRSPFDRQQFPSAASDALRAAARVELAQLLDRLQASGKRAESRPAS